LLLLFLLLISLLLLLLLLLMLFLLQLLLSMLLAVAAAAAAAADDDDDDDDDDVVVVFVFAVDPEDCCTSKVESLQHPHSALLQRARAQTLAGREGGGGIEGDTPRVASALNACFCNDCFQLDCEFVRL